MLAWTQIAQIALKTNITIPSQVLIEHTDELIKTNTTPVFPEEKLSLEPAKETFSAKEIPADKRRELIKALLDFAR